MNPVYHFQTAPVLKLPPCNSNVEDAPIADGVTAVAVADVGNVGLTVTIVFTQAVVLHVPSALT